MQNYVGLSFMWRTEYNGSSQWWNAIVTTKVRFTALFRHTFVNRTFWSEQILLRLTLDCGSSDFETYIAPGKVHTSIILKK